MKSLITLCCIILINFISLNLSSLEVSVPIKIYEILSKNVNPIVGASTIEINREEFSSKSNNLFHEVLDFNAGI